eukprot:2656423-Pleurochrysis_carterae.AAC.1
MFAALEREKLRAHDELAYLLLVTCTVSVHRKQKSALRRQSCKSSISFAGMPGKVYGAVIARLNA